MSPPQDALFSLCLPLLQAARSCWAAVQEAGGQLALPRVFTPSLPIYTGRFLRQREAQVAV